MIISELHLILLKTNNYNQMRKVLFIHDGPMMSSIEEDIFYGVHYNDTLIDRYTFFGDSVTFCMRLLKIEKKKGEQYTTINHSSFNFLEVPNFKSIKSYHQKSIAKQIIYTAVEQHDVLILRMPSAMAVIAYHYAKKIKKPIFIEVVACVYDALWNYNWKGKILAKYKMKRYQKLIKNASHVLYVTNKFLQKRYPTKGKQVGCSDVIIKSNNDEVLNKRINKIQSLHTDSVLTLGTIAAVDVPYKGQLDIIKVVSLLKKKGQKVKYKIVGQGNPQRLLEAINKFRVQELVEIIGPLPHNEVIKFIDTLDIYVQPSRQEGLPRVIVEAMSRACPVFGTNIAGIPELINSDCLFVPGDLQHLSRLINEINKDTLIKLANENYKKSLYFLESKLDDIRNNFYQEFFVDSHLE